MVVVQQKTTTISKSVEPKAQGEAPQTVYEKKKTIFRSYQVVWYILGLVEILLAFRFILKIFAANPFSGFVSLIYSLTDLLVAPFVGIFRVIATQGSVIEWSTLIAMVVYFIVAWGIIYLLDLFFPITPNDVKTS